MKNISENLKEHLSKEVTTLAKFILITCKGESVIALTSFDKEFEYDGNIYKPYLSAGILKDETNFSINTKENILSVFDSDLITEEQLINGKLDSADIEIFLLNYESPEDEKLILKKGFISKIIHDDNKFIIEISGYSSLLKNKITQNFSPNCRAKLGDSKCKINIEDFTFAGSVTAVISRSIFKDTSRNEAKSYFDKGIIKFTSGANNGIIKEVLEYGDDEIKTLTPFPNDIETGDTYEIIAGCDKNLSTCIAKFNNAVNFRGEPHIPGTDRIIKVG